eukprot:4074487-Pyramimonas_sp.AAC.1
MIIVLRLSPCLRIGERKPLPVDVRARVNAPPAQCRGTPAQCWGTPAQCWGTPPQCWGTPPQCWGTHQAPVWLVTTEGLAHSGRS